MNASDMLAGGARLVRTQPRAIALWGVLYLLFCLALLPLLAPMMESFATLQQQAALARAQQGAPPPLPPTFFALILLVDLGALLLLTVIFAAAVRATATSGTDRFGFLRIGMDELRLIGLGFILMIGWFVLMIAFVLVMVLIGVVLALIFGQNSAVLIVLVPLYLALYVATLWAMVRLSLAGALTVLRGRIVLRDAWRITRGRFWALFGVYLLVWLVACVIGIAAVAVTNPALLTFYVHAMQPQAAADLVAQQRALMATLWGPRMIAMMLVGTVFNSILLAFVCGAVATAAIRLDEAAATRDDEIDP